MNDMQASDNTIQLSHNVKELEDIILSECDDNELARADDFYRLQYSSQKLEMDPVIQNQCDDLTPPDFERSARPKDIAQKIRASTTPIRRKGFLFSSPPSSRNFYS